MGSGLYLMKCEYIRMGGSQLIGLLDKLDLINWKDSEGYYGEVSLLEVEEILGSKEMQRDHGMSDEEVEMLRSFYNEARKVFPEDDYVMVAVW